MTRKRLSIEDIEKLKFGEACRACKLVLTSACRNCDAGENFVDADEPEDTFEHMKRWS